MTTPAQFAGVMRHLTSRDIIVHQYRCVHVRNRHAACTKCADACTSGCISLVDGELCVDHEKCLGCGTCATVCPTCAIEAANPNDAVLLMRARRVLEASPSCDTVVFASQDMLETYTGTFDPARVVSVVNLGRVEETLLVQLVLAGAKRLVLATQPNAAEEHLVGAKTAAMVRDSANAILESWGSDARATLVDALPPEVLLGEPQTESALATKQGCEQAEQPCPEASAASVEAPVVPGTFNRIKVMRDGTLPHFMPDRREELIDALFELGEPVAQTVSSRLWGHVVIDPERCTGCRACATFCPTGALFKYAEEDGDTGIGHAPGDCVKCMSCRDVCREGAITVEDDVRCADILTGDVERFSMPPEELFRSNPHSIFNALKSTFKIDGVSER